MRVRSKHVDLVGLKVACDPVTNLLDFFGCSHLATESFPPIALSRHVCNINSREEKKGA